MYLQLSLWLFSFISVVYASGEVDGKLVLGKSYPRRFRDSYDRAGPSLTPKRVGLPKYTCQPVVSYEACPTFKNLYAPYPEPGQGEFLQNHAYQAIYQSHSNILEDLVYYAEAMQADLLIPPRDFSKNSQLMETVCKLVYWAYYSSFYTRDWDSCAGQKVTLLGDKLLGGDGPLSRAISITHEFTNTFESIAGGGIWRSFFSFIKKHVRDTGYNTHSFGDLSNIAIEMADQNLCSREGQPGRYICDDTTVRVIETLAIKTQRIPGRRLSDKDAKGRIRKLREDPDIPIEVASSRSWRTMEYFEKKYEEHRTEMQTNPLISRTQQRTRASNQVRTEGISTSVQVNGSSRRLGETDDFIHDSLLYLPDGSLIDFASPSESGYFSEILAVSDLHPSNPIYTPILIATETIFELNGKSPVKGVPYLYIDGKQYYFFDLLYQE